MQSDFSKLIDEKCKYRVYCKCGHSIFIYPFEKKEKKLCDWCGHYVYMNKRVEFIDRLKKMINKGFNTEGVYQ